jgi:hypothetical protein
MTEPQSRKVFSKSRLSMNIPNGLSDYSLDQLNAMLGSEFITPKRRDEIIEEIRLRTQTQEVRNDVFDSVFNSTNVSVKGSGTSNPTAARLRKVNKQILAGVGVLCFWSFFVFLGIDSVVLMPSSALLHVDVSAREYVSPPCLEHLNYSNSARFSMVLPKASLPNEFKQEARCSAGIPGWFTKKSGFHDQSSYGYRLLRRFLRLPDESRWNSDGTWNW